MNQHHTAKQRRFHRYCIECGNGHSKPAWNIATFCAQCGARLPKHSTVDAQKPPLRVGGSGRKRPVHRTDDLEVIPPSRNHSSGTWARKNDRRPRKVRNGEQNPWLHKSRKGEDWVTKTGSFVAQNPYTSATIGAAAGGLAITTGGALAAVGLSITTVGAGIMWGSVGIGLLSTFGSIAGPKRNPKMAHAGACVAIVGGLVGATISVTGALVSALGAALAFAGTVVITVSALLAVARSAQLCWEHREEIKRLLAKIREKLPGIQKVEMNLTKQKLEMRPAIS